MKRPMIVCGLLAIAAVVLSSFQEGEPQLADAWTTFDSNTQQFKVTGTIRYPSRATAHVFGWSSPTFVRTVPFQVTIPGPSVTSDMIRAKAIEATKDEAGEQEFYPLAFAGGWLACFLGFMLFWWLFLRRKTPTPAPAESEVR